MHTDNILENIEQPVIQMDCSDGQPVNSLFNHDYPKPKYLQTHFLKYHYPIQKLSRFENLKDTFLILYLNYPQS
jgi:hypothetical protein